MSRHSVLREEFCLLLFSRLIVSQLPNYPHLLFVKWLNYYISSVNELVMQATQNSPVIKHRRRKFSTAHARRRARAYSNAIKRELPVEQSADELRSSHESSLVNGSAAFLKGLLCETDAHAKGITERYETQREVSQKYNLLIFSTSTLQIVYRTPLLCQTFLLPLL